jgi:hypothetical protein
MKADYWVYVSPGYDTAKGAADVLADGQGLATGDRGGCAFVQS